jgi:hypothetical protein
MKVLAIHRIMPMLLLLLTASWGLIALFDMFEARITHLSCPGLKGKCYEIFASSFFH